ncbi:MAG TPA: DUF4127 family protein [Candidatus Baltobacteraceae bacterium]|jgi:hypothetical protein|nr:DUF4127 family protein [Candidatus Baltobacteraceae bacterium]
MRGVRKWTLRLAVASVLGFLAASGVWTARAQESPAPIAFIPLDDRPVSYQLPVMLGEIAGQRVLTPPRASIGKYIQPGDPDAIFTWLESPATRGISALVASSDMLVYGGLVASRLPGLPTYMGYERIRHLAELHRRLGAWTSVFGTLMRLAPTGLPSTGPAAQTYATGETVNDITAYASLPDPPQTDEDRRKAVELREKIGSDVLAQYLSARARNRDVDLLILQMAAEGDFDHVILGQDDAGRTGLHVRDLATLNTKRKHWGIEDRTSIEPGADELGMILLAEAFSRTIGWTPHIAVVYSRPDGGEIHDRVEYAPIDVTITHLIRACGGVRVTENPDITLYVRVAPTDDADEKRFVDAIVDDVTQQRSAAVADVSFLYGPTPGQQQQQLTLDLIARHVAGAVDGFASWNTSANTVGTALATAVAVSVGKQVGTYNSRAHAQFLLDRYADDFAFHQFVRPLIDHGLRAEKIDETLLTGGDLAAVDQTNRERLWAETLKLLQEIYPNWEDAGLTITLPWDRTFETKLDVRLR